MSQPSNQATSQPQLRRIPLWPWFVFLAITWAVGIGIVLLAQQTFQTSAPVFPYASILRFVASVDDRPDISLPGHQEGQVAVAAAVLPVRTIVVDENERVQEIWNNTLGQRYQVVVRRYSILGERVAYSPSVHQQYATLLPLIDWSAVGRAYPRGKDRPEGLSSIRNGEN